MNFGTLATASAAPHNTWSPHRLLKIQPVLSTASMNSRMSACCRSHRRFTKYTLLYGPIHVFSLPQVRFLEAMKPFTIVPTPFTQVPSNLWRILTESKPLPLRSIQSTAEKGTSPIILKKDCTGFVIAQSLSSLQHMK